jgi:hypothetical protein
MEFQIKPEDEPLIQAAIGMGDWLLAHPDTTEEQKQAIVLLQDGLRRLPAVTLGLNADYGFSIISADDAVVGLNRSWSVSLYPPYRLDIGNCYNPFPYPEGDEDYMALVHKMMAHELFYEIEAGKPNNIGTYYYEEWIAEVASPEPYLKQGYRLEIEASGKIDTEAEPATLPSP